MIRIPPYVPPVRQLPTWPPSVRHRIRAWFKASQVTR